MATPGSIENRYIANADFEHRRAEQEALGRELEAPFIEFLRFEGLRRGIIADVRHGTQTEDSQMIDALITLSNGKQIAAQLTFAHDADIRTEKLHRIERLPVASRLFDERGTPTRLEEPIPRVLISGGDTGAWKEALARHRAGQGPETFFKDPDERFDAILRQIPANFQYLSLRRPDYANVFGEYLKYFAAALPEEKPDAKRRKRG